MILAKLRQHRAILLLLGMIVLFSVTLLLSIITWHTDWKLIHQEIPSEPNLSIPVQTLSYDEVIPAAHLFGQDLVSTGQIPLTSLQLKLTGIVKSDPQAKDSKAYISLAGHPAKIYHIGDILSYGVKILDITAMAVMLENNGQVEKILLPRTQLEFKTIKNKEHLENE